MSDRILITGINGFVGTNLYHSVKFDFEIFGLDVYNKNLLPEKNFFSWDNLLHVPKIETIIHLAGKAHDTRNTSDCKEYYEINVGLTKTIFKYFLKSTATKFIFFSSVKAVLDSVEGTQLTEKTLPNPLSPYGKSKLEAEKFILQSWEEWKQEELAQGRDAFVKSVYILRPCMIHGPGNKGNLNTLYKFQQKSFPWPLGAFENKRSYCSIENILYVVRQIIVKNITSGTYQVADDESISTNYLISIISKSLSKNANIWNVSPTVIKVIAKAGDILGLPLNSERLKKLTESYVVSNKKLKNALGIEKMPMNAVEGMKMTLGYFINEIPLSGK
jgi:nucleoside-diphosphate-sugar epimerase